MLMDFQYAKMVMNMNKLPTKQIYLLAIKLSVTKIIEIIFSSSVPQEMVAEFQ